MDFSLENLMTETFDDRTAQGQGGDKVLAREKRLIFDARLTPIQRGIKNLTAEDPVVASTLMYFMTDVDTKKHAKVLEDHLRMLFVTPLTFEKGVHQSTVEKLRELIPLAVNYAKNHNAQKQMTKSVIAALLDLEANWYRTTKKICWDQTFKDLMTAMANLEDTGRFYMSDPYIIEVIENFTFSEASNG